MPEIEMLKPMRVRFIGNPIKYQKPNAGIRYACNGIDRADGLLRVLSMRSNVFVPVCRWAELNRKNPGGQDACDFQIEPVGHDGKLHFLVIAGPRSPLTAEERFNVRVNLWCLHALFKGFDPQPITWLQDEPPPTVADEPMAIEADVGC